MEESWLLLLLVVLPGDGSAHRSPRAIATSLQQRLRTRGVRLGGLCRLAGDGVGDACTRRVGPDAECVPVRRPVAPPSGMETQESVNAKIDAVDPLAGYGVCECRHSGALLPKTGEKRRPG